MSEFTPGPWVVKGRFPHQYIMAGHVCIIQSFGGGSVEADARLLASAPELLEALEAIAATWDFTGFHGPLIKNAKAAIAKARGQAVVS